MPVIKLEWAGIEIDLLFCRLAMEKVPDDTNLDDVELLRHIDQKCVRSLNGRARSSNGARVCGVCVCVCACVCVGVSNVPNPRRLRSGRFRSNWADTLAGPSRVRMTACGTAADQAAREW